MRKQNVVPTNHDMTRYMSGQEIMKLMRENSSGERRKLFRIFLPSGV